MNLFMMLYLGSCSIYDVRKGEIPSYLLYVGSVISTIFVVYKIQKIEMIVVYILYSSVPAIFCVFFSFLKLGVGEADIYILYSIGMIYGLYLTIFILLISSVGVFFYAIAFRRNWTRNISIPFIPFIFLATVIFLYLRV